MPNDESKAFFCPDCGAEITPWATKCWRCQCDFSPDLSENEMFAIPEEELYAPDKSANPEVKKASVPLRIASSIILTIVSGLVLTSIFLLAPGLGLLLAILAAPAMIGIFLKSERGNRSGNRSDNHPTVLKIVSTFLAVAGLGGILILCFIVTFLNACFGAIDPKNSDSDVNIILFGTAGVWLLLATIASLISRKLIKR
jgi:hypothetical protein